MTDIETTDCVVLAPVPPMTTDALSAPTGDALLPGFLALLPRGSAWRTDYVADSDDDSFLHRFWRAICEPVADLYAKAWDLALQSTACTVGSGLDDWEREFGLPDPCLATKAVQPDRLIALREKVAGEGGGSIPYFVCVAARLGYRIAITEPHFFECGISELRAPADGFDPPDQLGGDFQSWWIVHVLDAQGRYFELGVASVGYDRLSDFDSAADLECTFRARKPSHTSLVFDYSGAVGGDFSPAALRLDQAQGFFPGLG